MTINLTLSIIAIFILIALSRDDDGTVDLSKLLLVASCFAFGLLLWLIIGEPFFNPGAK